MRDFWSLIFQTVKKVPSIFSSFINCSDILALCFRWGRNKSVNYLHLFLSKLCHSDGPQSSNPSYQIVFLWRIINLLPLGKFHILLLLKVFCGLFIFFLCWTKLGRKWESSCFLMVFNGKVHYSHWLNHGNMGDSVGIHSTCMISPPILLLLVYSL